MIRRTPAPKQAVKHRSVADTVQATDTNCHGDMVVAEVMVYHRQSTHSGSSRVTVPRSQMSASVAPPNSASSLASTANARSFNRACSDAASLQSAGRTGSDLLTVRKGPALNQEQNPEVILCTRTGGIQVRTHQR